MSTSNRELGAQLVETLRDWASGRVPPDIAAMRLILLVPGDTAPAALLDEALRSADLEPNEAKHLRSLAEPVAADHEAWRRVRATAAAIPHDLAPENTAEAGVKRLAAQFDRAAKASPEASVALYSLGDPARLEAATAEIMDWLRFRGLLGMSRAALDIGCGIGRMAQALCRELGAITGCDISGEMIRTARDRCADMPNVAFRQTNGLDLASFNDEIFDLVLAVDVFPYLVATGGGLAEAHVRESARVLKPGGQLAIFNLSYRGSLEQDSQDLADWADSAGLQIVEIGAAPFNRWDAAAFRLIKP